MPACNFLGSSDSRYDVLQASNIKHLPSITTSNSTSTNALSTAPALCIDAPSSPLPSRNHLDNIHYAELTHSSDEPNYENIVIIPGKYSLTLHSCQKNFFLIINSFFIFCR